MTTFDKTYCSQCGGEFGPGDAGFSHCGGHATDASRKHTPAPWRTSSQSPLILKADSGCDHIVGESHELLGSLHRPEDAAFVVQCVNAHDELVAALQNLISGLSLGDEEGLIEHAPQMMAARAAVAKAESERSPLPEPHADTERGEPVPLTDDEVISLLDSNGIQCEPETAFAIVEIVERAHGIDLYASRGVQSPKPATE